MEQLNKDDLKGMSADEIVAAQKAGQLDDYLGRPARPGRDGRITADTLKSMSADEIVAARAAGQLDHLL